MTRWKNGVAAAWIVLCAGCATLSRDAHVNVSLVDLIPKQASVFETTAALTVRVINESPEPLALKGATHRLYLNGSYVGRAVSNEPLVVPRLGTATQTVTIYLENLALFRQAAELGKAARIRYELDSQLHLGESRWSNLRTRSSGEIDLSGLQQNLAPTGRAAYP